MIRAYTFQGLMTMMMTDILEERDMIVRLRVLTQPLKMLSWIRVPCWERRLESRLRDPLGLEGSQGWQAGMVYRDPLVRGVAEAGEGIRYNCPFKT